MNRILSFIKSNKILRNLLAVAGVSLGLLLSLLIYLHIYTLHGKAIAVPDFSDLPVEEAGRLIEDRNLRYEIFDSVFITDREKGVVVDQLPGAGFLVKKNRKIFLTINAIAPEKITMPDLVGLTIREAKLKMDVAGLQLGKRIYRFDIAKDVVLEQQVKNTIVEKGDTVIKGETVDLVLGGGLASERRMVPQLIGLSVEEAENKVVHAGFTISAAIPDLSVEENDTTIPTIFRQHPVHSEDVLVQLGSQITLWVTLDSSKFMEEEQPDSNYVWPELNDENDIENIEDGTHDYDHDYTE